MNSLLQARQAIEGDSTGISGLIARGRLNRQLCYLESAEADFNRYIVVTVVFFI